MEENLKTIYNVVCESWSKDGQELLGTGIVKSFMDEGKATDFVIECKEKTTSAQNKEFYIEPSFLVE